MVEFDELLITTGVDALVRLVKSRGRIEISEAARLLNLSEDAIEEWAGILEEQGILKIEYRLTRVFLVWISPTAEEVEEEKAGFQKRKEELRREIDEIRESVKKDELELAEFGKSFSEAYKNLSPKIAELEKKIDALSKARSTKTTKLDVNLDQIDEIEAKIDEIRSGLDESGKEIKGVSKKIDKGPTKKSIEKLDSLAADLKKMKESLAGLKKKAAQYGKAAPGKEALPSAKDMKVKLEQIMSEYRKTKERSAKLKQDLIELEEGKGVVQTIGKSMKDYDRKIGKLRKDIGALSKEANELKSKSEKIAASVEKDRDTLERFSDSMDVARGIVSRFPAAKNVKAELDSIKKAEKSIEERAKALKKLLEIASGAKVAAVEFDELSAQIDERMDELSSEIEDLSASLEEEKQTFLAYQSIRERIVPSLERNKSEISALSDQLKAMRSEIASQTESLEKEAKSLSEELGKSEVKEMMAVAAQVEEKRKLLDGIKDSVDSLAEMSENLERRLSILSRQASLIEIRAGGAEPGMELPAQKEKSIREQITLTRAEEEEYKKKREELRNLIKKLWEEEK